MSLTLWVGALAWGLKYLLVHSNTPGEPALTTDGLAQASSAFHLSQTEKTVLLFAHPKCPCSRASLRELEVLLTRAPKRAQTRVVFVQPNGWSEADVKTDLWETARSIPGVEVIIDPEGRQAEIFGALTSGQVLIYDENQQLLFKGGITGARGHEGDNAGLEAATAILRGEGAATAIAQSNVFGCSLFSPRHPAGDKTP